MDDHPKGLTRAELLRRGFLGLTALGVAPAVTSCGEPKPAARRSVEPEETYDVGYRETGALDPGFHVSRGLAARGEDLWVAGDMAVRQFREGRPTAEQDLPGAAQAVAAAPDGTLYAALDDRIVEIGAEGARPWDPLGPRARLAEVVATDEHVFAADAGNRCVLRWSRDGALQARLGDRDPQAGYPGLVVPSPYLGLALLPDGLLAVCNPGQHRVEIHSPEGKLARTLGRSGQGIEAFCGCCNPMSLAVLDNGDLVTAEKGIPRVKVLAPDGSLRTVVAPPSAFDPQTTGLELAVVGRRVLVLDPWEGKVRFFEPV